jgi:polyphosphate glucokinase
MQKEHVLGIDIGGSGIKGAIVDLSTGELLTERLRLATPQPSNPKAISKVVADLVELLGYRGDLVGVGFPSIVKNGIAMSAANINKLWIGTDIEKAFSQFTDAQVIAVNDADAAGLACMHYGIGKNVKGVVVLVTIGSGLGSALFYDGQLIPNTEFGHIRLNGMIAEHYASSAARKRDKLDWKEWGKRFNVYLEQLERILSPDLILLGGGASKKFDLYAKTIQVDTPVKPAELKNTAGVIGAAFNAANKVGILNKDI